MGRAEVIYQFLKADFYMKRIVSFFARRTFAEDSEGMQFIRIHLPTPAASGPIPIPITFLTKGKLKGKKGQK